MMNISLIDFEATDFKNLEWSVSTNPFLQETCYKVNEILSWGKLRFLPNFLCLTSPDPHHFHPEQVDGRTQLELHLITFANKIRSISHKLFVVMAPDDWSWDKESILHWPVTRICLFCLRFGLRRVEQVTVTTLWESMKLFCWFSNGAFTQRSLKSTPPSQHLSALSTKLILLSVLYPWTSS